MNFFRYISPGFSPVKGGYGRKAAKPRRKSAGPAGLAPRGRHSGIKEQKETPKRAYFFSKLDFSFFFVSKTDYFCMILAFCLLFRIFRAFSQFPFWREIQKCCWVTRARALTEFFLAGGLLYGSCLRVDFLATWRSCPKLN